MIIFDYSICDDMQSLCKAAIDNMPDDLLVSGARKMPDVLKGLKQDKPNIALVRQRVLAKLQLKSLPPPIIEILRTATLSEALIEVLSDKALDRGLPALLEHFGRLPILLAMLLDSRDSIRKTAQLEFAKHPKDSSKGKLQESETFKELFKPLLETLRPVPASLCAV